jgi:hypothetical protein
MPRQSYKNVKGYLDHWILLSSILGIIASIGMYIYMFFFMNIREIKPYLLFFTIFVLSISGIRYWRKETWD